MTTAKLKYPFTATAAELQLGDIVRLSEMAFCDAIVEKMTDDSVTFYRPYGRSDDFSYGDPPRVICLSGAEHFSASKYSKSTYQVLSRKDVK